MRKEDQSTPGAQRQHGGAGNALSDVHPGSEREGDHVGAGTEAANSPSGNCEGSSLRAWSPRIKKFDGIT